jgi:hypothetical protein
MLEFNVSRPVSADEAVAAELLEVRAQIVSLIAVHSRPLCSPAQSQSNVSGSTTDTAGMQRHHSLGATKWEARL